MGFELVQKEDCIPQGYKGDRFDVYIQLEADLKSQIKMCAKYYDHFRGYGDIPSANKFQQMMEHTKKDLSHLREAFKRGDPVPKFHHEMRAFSKNVCNIDLADTDLEFSVIRGINLTIPNAKDVHTYCKYVFNQPSRIGHSMKEIYHFEPLQAGVPVPKGDA